MNCLKGLFWCRICAFLVFCVLILILSGCSGHSNPITPNLENPVNTGEPGSGWLRWCPWSTGTDDDLVIANTSDKERTADITNIVWGNYGQSSLGWLIGDIKKEGQQGDFTGTVIAYVKKVGENDTDIFFTLCYENSVVEDEVIDEVQVDPTCGYPQVTPAVTAHLNPDMELLVDIVYLEKRMYIIPGNPPIMREHYRVMHARYKAETTGEDAFEFDLVETNELNDSFDDVDSCLRPDIVYDAGMADAGKRDFLHVVFEYFEYGNEDERDIYYYRGEPNDQDQDLVDWTGEGTINETTALNERPRIDAGIDTTGYDYDWDGQSNNEKIPYVAVVWQESEYDSENDLWISDVVFCRLEFDTGDVYDCDIIDWGEYDEMTQPHSNTHCVFPYVDIEPRENWQGDACTIIVWTWAIEVDDEGWYYDDADVRGTNTWRLDNSYAAVTLIHDELDDANGLATFAAIVDDDDDDGYGFLVWLNGDINTDQPEVYAVDVEWTYDQSWEFTVSQTLDDISKGYCGICSYADYSCFPEIAIKDGTIGQAVWTEFSLGTKPDVYSDFSDWD